MHIVIVTGMSGAGKSTVLKIFEDEGFHCVDNLPPTFIGQFTKLCLREDMGISQVALGVDIRGGKMFEDLSSGLLDLDELQVPYSILFLDASNDVLLKRYKETRHLHPLAKNDLVSVGINKERFLLEEAKQKATHIIDTSFILPRGLKDKIVSVFTNKDTPSRLVVNLLSFGYKNGIPQDSDLVFDVRFLPNPFYDPVLKPKSGLDSLVREYVMNHDISVRFLESLLAMLHLLIPHYISEGKSQLIVSIGCTGGRHRSVVLAREVKNTLNQWEQSVTLLHRDIGKDVDKSLRGD